jgi:hypothetical protein
LSLRAAGTCVVARIASIEEKIPVSIKRPEMLDEFTQKFIQLFPVSESEKQTVRRRKPRAQKPRPAPHYKASTGKPSAATVTARAAHALSDRRR